jgi:hypothetical protein
MRHPALIKCPGQIFLNIWVQGNCGAAVEYQVVMLRDVGLRSDDAAFENFSVGRNLAQ